MQARLQPGAHFLWIDEEPDRAGIIRAKGPHITPVGREIPKKVPAGLIHDWLELQARTDGTKDLFSMRLVSRSVVAKTALDTDVEASYFRAIPPASIARRRRLGGGLAG